MTPSDSEREEFEKTWWKDNHDVPPHRSHESADFDSVFALWQQLRTLEREKVELEERLKTVVELNSEVEGDFKEEVQSLTAQRDRFAKELVAIASWRNRVISDVVREAQSILEGK